MTANQIQDTNGVFVRAGFLGSFVVAIQRPLTVTNTSDAGPGSLRAALTNADADAPAADTITFSNSTAGGATNFYDGTAHTISLLSGLPRILGPITITGPGSALLNVTRGAGTIRIFDVAAGAGTVAVSGMTVSYGSAANSAGGGIRTVDAVLTLTDVAVTNNTAASAGGGAAAGGGGNAMTGPGVLNINDCNISNNQTIAGYNGPAGGGIYSSGGGAVNISNSVLSNNADDGGAVFANGPTTISNSTLSGNVGYFGGAFAITGQSGSLTLTNSTLTNGSARYGGGGYFSGANLTISGCTISGNTGTTYGGGLDIAGSGATNLTNDTISGGYSSYGGAMRLSSSGTTRIQGCKVTANTTTTTGNYGGAIEVDQGSLALDDTIVAGNFSNNGHNDIATVGSVAVASQYDAIGTSNGFTYVPGPGDLPVGAALNLSPLDNWGGPTKTIRLLAGSAAIDAGDPALNGTTDQRGISRPQGLRPDIGAYERVPGPDAVTSAANVTAAGGTNYTFTVTYADTVAINPATLRSGNVTVAGALTAGGAVAPAVTLIGANTANPNRVIATYQFTAPGGVWTTADNGTYTLTMQPNQVSDANGFRRPGQSARSRWPCR